MPSPPDQDKPIVEGKDMRAGIWYHILSISELGETTDPYDEDVLTDALADLDVLLNPLGSEQISKVGLYYATLQEAQAVEHLGILLDRLQPAWERREPRMDEPLWPEALQAARDTVKIFELQGMKDVYWANPNPTEKTTQ